MKLTACKLVFLLYLMFNLTACGTVLSLVEQDYRVYAGVIKDFQVMQEGVYSRCLR